MKRRNSTAYSSGRKSPPQPHDHCRCPGQHIVGFAAAVGARVWASVVLPAGELQYSTHSSNQCGVRLRTLAATYGCAPQSWQKRMNSAVPKVLRVVFLRARWRVAQLRGVSAEVRLRTVAGRARTTPVARL